MVLMEILTNILLCMIMHVSQQQQQPASNLCKQDVPQEHLGYGSEPGVLNLCELGKTHDFEYTVSSYNRTTQLSSTGSRTGGKENIFVRRYYSLNPFRAINDTVHNTNCPSNSTVCLISKFKMDSSGADGTCDVPSVTADSYAHMSNCTLTIKGKLGSPPVYVTARYRSTAGPCYYCHAVEHQVPLMSTTIDFVCDERIEEEGAPVLVQGPNVSRPVAVFEWKTSMACYQTKMAESCPHAGCPFHCQTKNGTFYLPVKKDLNFTMPSVGPKKTVYLFVACRGYVEQECDNNTIICQRSFKPHPSSSDGDLTTNAKPLLSFTDDVTTVVRPSGFVWRVHHKKSNRKLKGVVLFRCAQGFNLNFTAIIDLPAQSKDEPPAPLFILEGECFCRLLDFQQCLTRPTGLPSFPWTVLDITAGVFFFILVLFAFYKCRQKRPRPRPLPPPTPPPSISTAPTPTPPSSTTTTTTATTTTTPPSSSPTPTVNDLSELQDSTSTYSTAPSTANRSSDSSAYSSAFSTISNMLRSLYSPSPSACSEDYMGDADSRAATPLLAMNKTKRKRRRKKVSGTKSYTDEQGEGSFTSETTA